MNSLKKIQILCIICFTSFVLITLTSTINAAPTNKLKILKIDISNNESAEKLKLSELKDGIRFSVYGPFKQNNSNNIKISLNNDISTRIMVATYGSSDIREGEVFSSTIGNGYSLNSSVSITANKNGQYYIFVGAKDIKNLKGTLKFSGSKSSNSNKGITPKRKPNNKDNNFINYNKPAKIINNFKTTKDMESWMEKYKEKYKDIPIINNIEETKETIEYKPR